MTVLIGTSGWQYRHWKGLLYPTTLPQSQWLEYYGERFATVELNNAFYRLPEREQFEHWAARTPADFVMAVKASRYLTHVRRLHDPAEPVSRLLERLRGLGRKLGAVLLQLPPNLRRNTDALDETLQCFGGAVPVAVEFRHASWFDEEVEAVLRQHRAALCLADEAGPRSPMWRTADWGYVRFHRGRARPEPRYGRQALRTWAGRLAEQYPGGATIYAYFNNDALGCAPRDAASFAHEVERAGLEPSRVSVS